MKDSELQSSLNEEDSRIEILVNSLPTYFPKKAGSNNHNILGPIGEVADKTVSDLGKAQLATRVQNAETIPQLRELGRLVNRKPRENEALEHYRARLLASFQNITSQGSISNVINNAAFILGVDISSISYQETEEPGLINVGLPLSAIDGSSISGTEIASILEENIAAGYSLNSVATGSFTYMSPEQYNSNEHDPDLGYTTLDTNGDPINSGGTYSRTI